MGAHTVGELAEWHWGYTPGRPDLRPDADRFIGGKHSSHGHITPLHRAIDASDKMQKLHAHAAHHLDQAELHPKGSEKHKRHSRMAKKLGVLAHVYHTLSNTHAANTSPEDHEKYLPHRQMMVGHEDPNEPRYHKGRLAWDDTKSREHHGLPKHASKLHYASRLTDVAQKLRRNLKDLKAKKAASKAKPEASTPKE
jgi:hypothetical protein